MPQNFWMCFSSSGKDLEEHLEEHSQKKRSIALPIFFAYAKPVKMAFCRNRGIHLIYFYLSIAHDLVIIDIDMHTNYKNYNSFKLYPVAIWDFHHISDMVRRSEVRLH